MTTLPELDAALARLRTAAARIATNLAELDRDPTRELLDVAMLQGETAVRWSEASQHLANLWLWYTKLTDHLDAAVAVRGQRTWLSAAKLAALTKLLTDSVIEVDTVDVPVNERNLVGSSQATSSCTADELLARMTTAFDEVTNVVARCATAWTDLVPRVGAARVAYDQKASDAATVDRRLQDALAVMRKRFDAVAHQLVTDPLSVAPAMVDALELELRDLGDELFLDADRRDALQERLHDAERLVTRLRDVESGAADRVAAVSYKIAGTFIVLSPALASDFARELIAIRNLVDSGWWADADRGITRWSERMAAAIDAKTAAIATADARLDERAQLRGRLDAYLAKAHASELAEDDEVVRLYDEAHRVLYTAPTDLGLASELVAYQAAVSKVRSVPQ